MSKKDADLGGNLRLHGLRLGICLGAFTKFWAVLDPTTFATELLPLLEAGGLGCFATAGGIYLWARFRRPVVPTHEDWACGTYITGLPGSGKTALAYLFVREFCTQRWGWIWLSIKSSLPLLQYLPKEAQAKCLLFAPYSNHPLGINFLRTYTRSSTERELIADQTAELFRRLHSAMSSNMRELIRMGTLALLQWADRTGVEVTLWELYRFFQEEAFRRQVLAESPRPVRDAFASDEVRKQTLQAVKVQLRRGVTSENLLVALSQRDGIDLWEVMQQERWLVCDTPEALLGPAVASFICQVVASRVQMLTSRRPSKARPFAVLADEFQEYANSSFAKGIATGREFGLAWFLIHQSRSNQGLSSEITGAVHLCGTRYYFQQSPEDVKAAVDATEGRWEPTVFTHLPKRHFRAVKRLRGRPIVMAGVTSELPSPDQATVDAVIARASGGPGRQEILREIQGRKVGSRHDAHGEGTRTAEGHV